MQECKVVQKSAREGGFNEAMLPLKMEGKLPVTAVSMGTWQMSAQAPAVVQ